MARVFGRPRRDDAAPPPGTALEALLEDVRDLRLTLAADLSTAAGATEMGATDVAADIVEADRQEVARFARGIDDRLRRLQSVSSAPEPRPVWRRRLTVALPVAPVVGALALSAAAATGVLPLPGLHAPGHRAAATASTAQPTTPLPSSFQHLVSVVGNDPSASQVIAAASKLHRQLNRLIANSQDNPASVAEVAQLLQLEQSLLMRAQPPGASVVLTATRKLAEKLVSLTPVATASTSPTTVPVVVTPPASPRPHRHHPAASPSPSASKSASPAPSPSKPQPAPSSSPSADPIPHVPGG